MWMFWGFVAGGLALSALAGALGGGWGLALVAPAAISGLLAVKVLELRGQRRLLEHERAQVQALLGVHAALSPRLPLPPMTSWAATPELAAVLVEEVLTARPKVILEAGSGVSTLVNAYALEKLGGEGRVLSLDHDLAFGAVTRRRLARHGLEGLARVVDAPLVEHALGGERWRWYDLAGVPADLRVDVLVVDGPPVETQPLARYPALPLLASRLAPGALIVLDDAARPSERAVVARWLAEHPGLEHVYLPTIRGTSLLRWPG